MITLTRKIELVPIGDTKEERAVTWKKVAHFSRTCCEMANKIVARHYLTFCEGLELSDGSPKSFTSKELREYIKAKHDSSVQNLGYAITKSYKEVPSYVRAALSNQVFSLFKQDIFDVQIGKRAMRTYKPNSPMPTMKSSLIFKKDNGQVFLTWCKMDFVLAFGRDKSDNRTIVDRILAKEYQLCDSSIQYNRERNKIFLLLSYKQPIAQQKLDEKLCVGVDLGLNAPAYCALSEGEGRERIGDRETLLKPRINIQARRRNLQRQLKFIEGGKGRKKKLEALNKLRQKEKNAVRTINHRISKSVIDFALKHKAGVIKLEDLSGIARDEKSKWVLRNWSYYELQQLISYKAQKVGIAVKYIKAAYTSQTCPVCGNVSREQRQTQAVFQCVNVACADVGKEKNADYVGALNIARSEQYVQRTKKKQKKQADKKA